MRFKPLSKKYKFDEKVLALDFPPYMQQPIANWLTTILEDRERLAMPDGLYYTGNPYLKDAFRDAIQTAFREQFPQDWNKCLGFIFNDTDRTVSFLQLCLQNYAKGNEAAQLENILSVGGSGYEVVKTNKAASEYDQGVYDLNERVPTTVKEQAAKALGANDLLHEAWQACYEPKPNYEKTVSESCDFLENYLGKIYFPNDPKPQLKKFVHAFESDPSKLSYKGDTIVQPKSLLTSLLKEASNIRGQHKAGNGRKPTRQEAELVLHVTILIWNMHQKAGK
jgi:hypothetical protein